RRTPACSSRTIVAQSTPNTRPVVTPSGDIPNAIRSVFATAGSWVRLTRACRMAMESGPRRTRAMPFQRISYDRIVPRLRGTALRVSLRLGLADELVAPSGMACRPRTLRGGGAEPEARCYPGPRGRTIDRGPRPAAPIECGATATVPARSTRIGPAMPHAPYRLGLDVGTQSLRAALVDLEGKTAAFGVAPIDTTYPRPTWAEQDPDQWWRSAQSAVAEALATAGVGPEQVAGIGLD